MLSNLYKIIFELFFALINALEIIDISADLSTRPDMLIFITFYYTNITQGAAKLETNIKKKLKKI